MKCHYFEQVDIQPIIVTTAYPSFCSMNQIGAFLLLLDGMLVHQGLHSPPALSLPVAIYMYRYMYTPGWREAQTEIKVSLARATSLPL